MKWCGRASINTKLSSGCPDASATTQTDAVKSVARSPEWTSLSPSRPLLSATAINAKRQREDDDEKQDAASMGR